VASNRVPLWKIYFGDLKRYNPISVSSLLEIYLQEMFFFGLVVGEGQKWVWISLLVALSKLGMGLIFWVTVVGSLTVE